VNKPITTPDRALAIISAQRKGRDLLAEEAESKRTRKITINRIVFGVLLAIGVAGACQERGAHDDSNKRVTQLRAEAQFCLHTSPEHAKNCVIKKTSLLIVRAEELKEALEL